MADKEFTAAEVSSHTTKKDLYMIIHDQVYDTSKFVDEHPGGEEVLLDVGGQDATEAFEDVGHSDEARDILKDLLVGSLKRAPGDAAPKATSNKISTPNADRAASGSSGLGPAAYVLLIAGGALAYFAYQYFQSQQQSSASTKA